MWTGSPAAAGPLREARAWAPLRRWSSVRPVIAPSGEQIELALGEQQAVVVEVGGGLRSYAVAGRDLLDGYGPRRAEHVGPGAGADAVAEPGAGRLVRVRRSPAPAAARRAGVEQRDPRPRPVGELDGRRAGAEPRRDGAHAPSPLRLSLHARPGGRVRARPGRPAASGRRRRTPGPVRARSGPVRTPISRWARRRSTRSSCASPREPSCAPTRTASRPPATPSPGPSTTSAWPGCSARPGSTMPSPISSETRTDSHASSSATRRARRG